MNAIDTTGLGRLYRTGGREVTALRDIQLTVPAGQTVGLLGANGAGKTTLVKILATLLLPTSGTARIGGHDVVADPRRVRREISVVFGGDRGFYGRLSGWDNLRFFGMLRGLSKRRLAARAEEMLAEVGLAEAADRRVETYSKGMRQRLHIAVGLIEVPSVLLLDEPTIGLDPTEAERLRGTIAGLRAAGVTVLITSHQLLDIERLADRVVLLHKGAITHDMPLARFRSEARYVATVRVTGVGEPPGTGRDPDGGPLVTGVTMAGDVWTATVQVSTWDDETLRWLGARLAGGRVVGLDVAPVRLEDVYGQIVKDLVE